MVSTQRFRSGGALGPTSGAGEATGEGGRGPVPPIHEVMGCGAADSPLLIADCHRLSPYKSPQLHSIQEDLAQATGMGGGGEGGDTDLGQ